MEDEKNEFINYENKHIANLPPYNWLEKAKVYNHHYEKISYKDLSEGIDIIILSFSLKGKDTRDFTKKFQELFLNAKHKKMPIEVINVPMDDTKENMCLSFVEQPEWYTLIFNDPLIPTLQYLYGVTSVPHLVIIKPDGSVITHTGILDVEEYGNNALMAWMSSAANSNAHRRFTWTVMRGKEEEVEEEREKWEHDVIGGGRAVKQMYRRKFHLLPQMDKLQPR